jgi:hypothetical protein
VAYVWENLFHGFIHIHSNLPNNTYIFFTVLFVVWNYKMSSSAAQTANTILSTGILIAIIVPSVIVGLAILICIICLIYCACCRKSKSYPGAVINQQPYPAPGYTNPPPYPATNYNNQPTNKVWYLRNYIMFIFNYWRQNCIKSFRRNMSLFCFFSYYNKYKI